MDVNEARKLKALEEENSRMKRIIADQAMQIDILKEVNLKKVVSVAAKKKVVRALIEQGIAKVSQICRALSLNKSSFYAPSQRCVESFELECKILELSRKNPR